MSVPDWLSQTRQHRFPWATDGQWNCLRLLADTVGGFHHLFGKIIPIKSWQDGIICDLECHNYLSTYDYSNLTKLVIWAHDRCIRVEIKPSGRAKLKIVLTQRVRIGSESERHPTLEQAIEMWRIIEATP